VSENIEFTEPGITNIGQIAIAVSDIQQSTTFYRDGLGLALLFEVPPSMAFFDCGGIRLMLTTSQGNEKDHRTSVIYYKVAELDKATEVLEANGINFEREPQLVAKMEDHELWIGFLRDPDENLVGIMAEVQLP
jgi:methylmalonyl-CoA/ethylmalonyl-CoA epimerase